MMKNYSIFLMLLLAIGLHVDVYGQSSDPAENPVEKTADTRDAASGETAAGNTAPTNDDPTTESATAKTSAQEGVRTKDFGSKIDEIAESVDQNPTAREAQQSIIGWIYDAAEYLSFSWFHWIAFALMVAGLISFALQLVVGKLLMLFQFHFSLTEVLADALGFAISAIGLILTTQAATDKSTFTESPMMVLSAALVGLLFGLVFFVRGQTQEFREAREVRRRRKAD